MGDCQFHVPNAILGIFDAGVVCATYQSNYDWDGNTGNQTGQNIEKLPNILFGASWLVVLWHKYFVKVIRKIKYKECSKKIQCTSPNGEFN